MISFTCERISPMVTRIMDGSDVCEYLVEGRERALLIDTGYGIGDLKSYIETITDKPYDVYVTHGHVDHASGAAQFDRVFMNLKDMELFAEHCEDSFRREVVVTHTALRPDEGDYIPQRREPFAELKDGDVADLGGATVRFVHVPGHTRGTMVPILEEERTAFFGDACGVGVLLMHPEASTVREYLSSLKKLKSCGYLYDRVLRQHGTFSSTPRVLDDNIENCENILAGRDDHVEHEFMGRTCYWACRVDANGVRADGREGNIRYTPDHIG